jgi:hypothetical protein
MPVLPPEFTNDNHQSFHVNFDDIDQSPYKDAIIALTKAGVISNTEEIFRGHDLITCVEALG